MQVPTAGLADDKRGLGLEIFFGDCHDFADLPEENEDVPDDEDERLEAARAQALAPVQAIIDNELEPLFDQRKRGPGRPPQAGDGYSVVLSWLATTAAGGLAWDVLKRVISPLWRMMKLSRDNDLGVELDARGLLLLAIGEAKRRARDFSTNTGLVRTIEDNQGDQFPLAGGVFVFLLPDLQNSNCHIVVLNSFGHLLLHQVGDFLTNDAEAFLEEAPDVGWEWSSDEGWGW